MKKPPEQASATEDTLFRQAMAGVTPITPKQRAPDIKPAKPVPIPRTSQQIPASNFFSDHGANDIPATSFLRPGLNSMTLRKLRRGTWPIQDEIDLHGHTVEEARRRLFSFLNHAVQQNFRCVNVIHGKGWQAGGAEGVIKIHTRHWLTQFSQVLAFCEPPANAGGGGAVWVLLKSNNKISQ